MAVIPGLRRRLKSDAPGSEASLGYVDKAINALNVIPSTLIRSVCAYQGQPKWFEFPWPVRIFKVRVS